MINEANNRAAIPAGEILYNGIELPSPWPPEIDKYKYTGEPMPVPYLANPPAVIPIDVGRQLFVDDFLIETTSLQRNFHVPQACPANPILKPDKPWEKSTEEEIEYPWAFGAYAMPFSDGVWYDPGEKLFKMWYIAGVLKGTFYAVSTDGVRWEKPSLDVLPGTNLVYPCRRDSSTIWLDLEEPDPKYRYKMFWYKVPNHGEPAGTFNYVASADGIHWGKVIARSAMRYDRSTVFFNPFRKKWVAGLRYGDPVVARFRRYREADNPVELVTWKDSDDNPLWCGGDRLDPVHPEYNYRPELYNLDCVAYESLMLGFFSILRGDALRDLGRPKRNEIFMGFSRDGFHWNRPFRQPFIGVSDKQGDWNWGNVQSVGGGCLVVGDELYFYASGRAGNGRVSKDEGFWDAEGATGLAVLRRDGFASMDAGSSEGLLLTRPVQFSGRFLFVNARIDGELKVEVLDEKEQPIPGLARQDCLAVQGDKTLLPVTWKNGKDLSGLNGKPIRFKFYLTNTSLYSFWVGSDTSGASGGYVAAGGPGFTGPTDTVGLTSYRSTNK